MTHLHAMDILIRESEAADNRYPFSRSPWLHADWLISICQIPPSAIRECRNRGMIESRETLNGLEVRIK